jgi:hypothetical protein
MNISRVRFLISAMLIAIVTLTVQWRARDSQRKHRTLRQCLRRDCCRSMELILLSILRGLTLHNSPASQRPTRTLVHLKRSSRSGKDSNRADSTCSDFRLTLETLRLQSTDSLTFAFGGRRTMSRWFRF